LSDSPGWSFDSPETHTAYRNTDDHRHRAKDGCKYTNGVTLQSGLNHYKGV